MHQKHQNPTLRHAREMLDRLDGAEFQFAREHAERDLYELEAQQADAFVRRCAVRRQAQSRPQPEMVYKTYQTEPQQTARACGRTRIGMTA
jgi:hypothetical protein